MMLFMFLVGYTTADVLYRWNSRAVAISEDLRMSQFDLIDVPSSNESIRVGSEKQGKVVSKFATRLLTKAVENLQKGDSLTRQPIVNREFIK